MGVTSLIDEADDEDITDCEAKALPTANLPKRTSPNSNYVTSVVVSEFRISKRITTCSFSLKSYLLFLSFSGISHGNKEPNEI
eukprot:719504-Amphidinium_carterae.1